MTCRLCSRAAFWGPVILAAWCRSLAGQAAGATEPTALRPVTMTAGAQYRAGWLHRWLLGAHYRDLWTTPLQVDVVEPRLMVMPDDPRLDSFPAFKEMLGLLEERPTVDPDEEVGFAGAERIASTQKVWDHLTADSRHRADSRALLAARLVDVLVGDWDRHPEQWRWARFDEAGVHVWRPIPRDRDQAFSRLDGLLPWIARYYHPDIVSFGDRYPDLVGLTWNGRALDRRVLNDLEKPVWDSVAAALQAGLSDTVIDRAVHRLPPEYYARDGNRLAQALKRRRDGLRQMANRYYALLAGAVDVQATDEADVADVQRS